MSETVETVKDETPAHPNFITLGKFAEMRDAAPRLSRDIGSSVVFLVNENGTYRILNGRIYGIVHEEYGSRYSVMVRNGRMIENLNTAHVVAV